MGDLDYEESWALKNWCSWTVVLGKILRVPWSARRSNQSIRKSVLNIHWKDWCWSWNSSSLVTWCEELTHWKRPWCWERLKVGGEGDDRGWDGWVASPTQWTWVWVNSRSWWWTGRPGMLQSMGPQSQTRLSNWTELNQTIAVSRYHSVKSGRSMTLHRNQQTYQQCPHPALPPLPLKFDFHSLFSVWMWEFNHKEGWVPKNQCFQTVVLRKALDGPLDSKEVLPVHPQGNQPWIFTGRTDAEAEAEAPRLWPPYEKNWLTGKDPDAGKDGGQEEKGGNRGWDGWMASPTQWTWVWEDFRRWWRTGKPGVLQSIGSPRVGHDLVTEQ